MDAEFNIKVKECDLNDIRSLLADDDCEIIKFNRYSPRLAGKDFSVETIQKQIIGLDNIINHTEETEKVAPRTKFERSANVVKGNFSKFNGDSLNDQIENHVRMEASKAPGYKPSNTEVKYIKSLEGKKKIMDGHNYYVEEEDMSFYEDIMREDEEERKSPIKSFFSKILSSLLGTA